MLRDLFGRFAPRENPAVATLLETPFFRELSWRETREIERVLQYKAFAPGEAVFDQGRPGAGMFFVLSGRVEILREEEDGTVLRLSQAGPGMFFGELALLDDAPRTARAVAAEDTELGVFFRADLLSLSEQYPRLGVKIVIHLSQIVAERLRRANRALKDVRDELEAAQKQPEADSDTP